MRLWFRKKAEHPERYVVDEGVIIDNPALVKKTRRFTEVSLGVLGWILWVIIMRPLFVLLTWYVAYRFLKFEMFYLEGIKNPHYYAYGFVVMVCLFLIIIGWNRYNAWRFRGIDRRKSRGVADAESMAGRYRMPVEFMTRLRDAKLVRVHFPEREKIVVETDAGESAEGYYNPRGG